MSNKLLGKIMIVLIALIGVFLLIYAFTKKDNSKNNDNSNYSESQLNNNLENDGTPDNNQPAEEENNELPNNNQQNQEENKKEENLNQGNEVNNDENDSDNKTPIVGNKKIILEDRTKGQMCAQAIEYFYEDANYRYYFTCIKSNSMYVIINDNEYKLVDALQNGIVTIKELENNGYTFLKESKNVQDR